MLRYITEAPGLPRWASPVSHAVVAGGMCFVSGQLSLAESGEYLPGSAAEETGRAFENLRRVLNAAGFALSDLVFVDVALAEIADTAAVNAVYRAIFPEHRRPARTVCQAAGLPFGARVKIMAIAVAAKEEPNGIR